MMWFDRMTVFRKLLLAFAVVIGFCVVIGGTSLKTLSSMHDITDAICDKYMDGLYWLEEANRHEIDADLAAANLGYVTDDAGRQKLKGSIVGSLKLMHEGYERYRATIVTAKGRQMFDDVLGKSAEREGIVHQQIGLAPIPAGVDNNELVRRAIASSEALRDRITALIDYRRQQGNDAQTEAASEYERMRVAMVALVLGAIVAGGLLATMIARRLSRQLGGEPDYAMQLANCIADGDLSVRVETRAGDTHSMLYALRNMRERLAAIVSGISESSESILTASGEIAQGNTDLSQRTEEQAAAAAAASSMADQARQLQQAVTVFSLEATRA
jgi:methyl-accepting chemotaxis protein